MEHGFDSLTQADLDGLSNWVLAAEVDARSLEPQQWLAVVEMFTEQATTHADRGAPVRWASVLEAYPRLLHLAHVAGILSPQEVAVRRLNFIGVLLQYLQSDADIDLLNPVQAIRDFLEEVPLSLDDATRLAAHWQDLDVSEIRRLRYTKNLLKPAVRIGTHLTEGQEKSRLGEWESLMPLLP